MLIPIVRAAHKESKGTYGARRIAIEVEAHGSSCGRFKARSLMKLAGVAAKQKKKLKFLTWLNMLSLRYYPYTHGVWNAIFQWQYA